MKFKTFTFVIPPDAADAFPDIWVHGRGQDPRGPDIEAWEKAERERLERVEARRVAAETAARAAQITKPEAAE